MQQSTHQPPTGIVSTMATNGDVGTGNSLLIDPSGVMHVPFSDETNDVLEVRYEINRLDSNEGNNRSIR